MYRLQIDYNRITRVDFNSIIHIDHNGVEKKSVFIERAQNIYARHYAKKVITLKSIQQECFYPKWKAMKLLVSPHFFLSISANAVLHGYILKLDWILARK